MSKSLTFKVNRDTHQNTIFTFSSSSQPPPPPPVFTFPSSSSSTLAPAPTKPPSPPSFTFLSSTTTPLPSPPSPSPPVFTFPSRTHSQPPFTSPSSSSTPTPAFIFSASSTKPPSPSSFTFSSSTTTPLPSPPSPLPPVFSFPSSSTPLSSPLVFTFSSSSKLPPSPPVFTFSSSSSSTPPPPPLLPSPPIYFSFPSSSTPLPPPPIFTFSSSSSSTPQPPPPPPAVSPSPSRVRKSKRFLKTQRKVVVNDDDKKEAEAEGVICEICAESRGNDDMYRNRNCEHSFCCECIRKQVSTKIQESITVISCPALNCNGELELDACRVVLPKELTEKWENAACEALFVAAPKLYCPFRDCSAMLLVENEEAAIREAECPFCHRLFCARCGVPWHSDVACEELQSLNEDERGRDDLLLRDLAGQKKWNRCPRCKFYVEKTEGCLHITCRCRFEFCYACGEPWTSTHGGCQRN